MNTEFCKTEIEKLANFIMAEVEGEPSQSESAVDCAIRIITAVQADCDALELWKFMHSDDNETVINSYVLELDNACKEELATRQENTTLRTQLAEAQDNLEIQTGSNSELREQNQHLRIQLSEAKDELKMEIMAGQIRLDKAQAEVERQAIEIKAKSKAISTLQEIYNDPR